MIAEAAESNPTVFSKDVLPWHQTVKEFLEIAKKYKNNIGNTKYMLSRLVPGKSKFFQYYAQCKTVEDLDHISSLIDDNGEPKGDPSEYLIKRREEEKLLKRQEGERKALERKLAKQQKRELEVESDSNKKPKLD